MSLINMRVAIIRFLGILFLASACTKNTSSIIPIENPARRYKDSLFKVVNKSTLQYDVQLNFQAQPVNLLADFYQPAGDNDISRALIIYLHGGGFSEGTRDGDNLPYFCSQLAKKGFVVASIDYRLGFPVNSSITEYGKAQIRAVQDLKSFIRFEKQNASIYKTDTTKIFISGSSAGGAAALATAFLDYSERPSYVDSAGIGNFGGKGNLNGHSFKTKAVYSLWGAVIDTLWINKGNIPVGTIQSISDSCIPWNSGPSNCQVEGYSIFGSNAINRRANSLGIYSSIYGFNSNDHELGLNFPYIDTTIAKMSEFLYPLAK